MIPPTRYIDAGPGVALANPQASMVEAQAYARMGQTIQHIGAKGFEVAEKVRKIDENRKMTELFSQMDQEAADFSNDLMRREDTDQWGKDWREKSVGWKELAKEKGLSPEGMAAFDERFTRWNTQRSIGFETQAASKSIELGRATFDNAYQANMNRRNYAGALEDLDSAHRAGLVSAPERDKVEMNIQQTERHNGILADINNDPRAWMEANPADQPPADYDPIKWRQLHGHASGIERDMDGATSDGLLDKIVSNQATLKDIEAANLRPLQKQKLVDAFDRWNAEGAKELRADPKNIAANVGKFYAALDDWKPDAEGQDPAGVELRMIMENVPEGHPLRDKMRESMSARKSRLDGEVKTRADQGLASLKLAAERGDFGPVKPPTAKKVETRKAVADGYLQDIPKLQSLGFSQGQAEAVREVAKKDPAMGQEKFNELWKARPQDSVNATPFDIAVADAIRLENGTVQWDADIPGAEMDAHEGAARSYGEAMIELESWIKLNPNANEKDMGTKLRELGSKSARVTPVTAGPVKRAPTRTTPALPGETSMNLPEPLKTLAPTFQAEGTRHGLDPRLLAAIAMHETGNGTSSAFKNKKNAMGVSNSSGPISFDDSTASVAKMARLLGSDKGPYKNATTLAEIGAIYAPADADNDPNDLNQHWVNGVSKYLRQLGGDPDKIFTNS